MFLLGRKTAREKVATLLSLIATRLARNGCKPAIENAPVTFDLPISRMEMADSLGLTTETVCREIRHLKSRGLITTKGRRHVSVPDLSALRILAESEQA
jgi:CRP/FNR family transcriptional regulator